MGERGQGRVPSAQVGVRGHPARRGNSLPDRSRAPGQKPAQGSDAQQACCAGTPAQLRGHGLRQSLLCTCGALTCGARRLLLFARLVRHAPRPPCLSGEGPKVFSFRVSTILADGWKDQRGGLTETKLCGIPALPSLPPSPSPSLPPSLPSPPFLPPSLPSPSLPPSRPPLLSVRP